MPKHCFHLLNVFAEKPLSGDPMVIFECTQMPDLQVRQALAYQMGGSEIAFLQSNQLELHIHSPQFTLPFSGRAVLGAAAVLVKHDSNFRSATFKSESGNTAVEYNGEIFSFISVAGSTRPFFRGHLEIAQALGIDARDIISPILFVDSGLEQLMIQVRSRQSVLQAQPHAGLLARCIESPKSIVQATIWSTESDLITLRCFNADSLNMSEDFASGSAACNLASYLLATGSKAPLQFKIEQGHTIQKLISRLSVLSVKIDLQLQIHVSGKVSYLGSGIIEL